MFYPIFLEYVGPNSSSIPAHLRERIRVLRKPSQTNLSHEERLKGWLGTTDDWSKTALGEHDADSLRELLHEHGVQIPDACPVRYTEYSVGAETSEEFNRHAYRKGD